MDFPANPIYSVAGKKEDIRDPRDTLFYEILRITKTKQPTCSFSKTPHVAQYQPRTNFPNNPQKTSGKWVYTYANEKFLTTNTSKYLNPDVESTLSHILLPQIW